MIKDHKFYLLMAMISVSIICRLIFPDNYLININYSRNRVVRRVREFAGIKEVLIKLKEKYPRLDFSDIETYPAVLSGLLNQVKKLGLSIEEFIEQICLTVEELEKVAEEKVFGHKWQFFSIKIGYGPDYFAEQVLLTHTLIVSISALLSLAEDIEDLDLRRFMRGVVAHEIAHSIVGLAYVLGQDGDISPADWLERFLRGIELTYVEGIQFNPHLLKAHFSPDDSFYILSEIAADKVSVELIGDDYMYTQLKLAQDLLTQYSKGITEVNLIPLVSSIVYLAENDLSDLVNQLREILYYEFKIELGKGLESALRQYYKNIRIKTRIP